MHNDDDIGYPALGALEASMGGLPQEIHARERMLELRREAAVRRFRDRARPARAPQQWKSLWPLPMFRALRTRGVASLRRRRLEPRLGTGDG